MIIELEETTDEVTKTTEKYIKEFDNVEFVEVDNDTYTLKGRNGAFTVKITIKKSDLPGLFIKEDSKKE